MVRGLLGALSAPLLPTAEQPPRGQQWPQSRGNRNLGVQAGPDSDPQRSGSGVLNVRNLIGKECVWRREKR